MASARSEQDLARSAVAGDRDALSELLYRHYTPVETIIRRGIPEDLRDKLDAEDVLQDVHVEAFRTIAKLDPDGGDAFIRWLTTMALAGLDEPYREAIRLRYIERLKVTEIAERLKKTEGAAQMLCHRGLRKLKEALGRASRYLSS